MTAAQPRLIVVSNRGPVSYARDDRGRRVARRGAGGLVTALAPLVSRGEVTWIASAGTDEERRVAAEGVVEETASDGARYRLRLVAHDPDAYRLTYDVVANPALWFLQHGLWERLLDPGRDLRPAWRDGYEVVNRGFAEAVLDELERDPSRPVLFQDYHLYRAPRQVRERRPDAVLAHFVHIPWVGPDAWSVLPHELAASVHDGLAACDTVGFHTRRWRDAFAASSAAYLGAGALERTELVANPISPDVAEFEELAASPAVGEREQALVAERPELLVLRVDRTDPSKNAVRGFDAYGRLLERRPDLRGRVGMLALLDPSRQSIPEYVIYRRELEEAARAVNHRFGTSTWQPVRLEIRDDFPASVAAYRQFDVLLVNPVRDGMNLVVKEASLVNVRDGAVVLSTEAGAYEELADWVVPVDPLDVDGQAAALEQALCLPREERRVRLEGIRARVREHDLDAWLAEQLAAIDRATMRR